MKKFVSFLLVLTVILSLGVTAFAAGSPSRSKTSGTTTSSKPVATQRGLSLYDANDKRIAVVPAGSIKKVAVANAKRLPDEERESFLAAYEDAKKVEGKVVKYFYWLDIPAKYKTDDFAYAKYIFTCTGNNVEVMVNGKKMEVEKTGRNTYCAKLTEFGSVAILCD